MARQFMREQMQVTALLLTAILLIVLDQLTKSFVLSRLREGQSASFGLVTIRRFLNQNVHGRVFQRDATLLTLWIAEFIILVSVIQFVPIFQGVVAPISLGAALGGAGSNVLDRVWRDGVVDFIDFKFWPVFNLADVAIVMGVVIGVFHS
jgi:signal peptidase II